MILAIALTKYRELRNLSHEASFKAAQSNESYVHMKGVLSKIIGSYDPCNAQENDVRYGPEIAQALHEELPNVDKVLDPVPVKPKGAPKKRKRMESFRKNKGQ